MKKILRLIAIAFTTFWGCNESTKVATPQREINVPAIPIGAKQWGKSFAENLGSTIKKNRELSTLDSIKINSFEKSELFVNSISKFSLSQLKIFKALAKARVESKSYISFSKRLEEICSDISKSVPKFRAG